MKKTSNKNDFKILTIGTPKFSNLSKENLHYLIFCLEFQIRDFYKDKCQNKIQSAKTIND